ncbi:MAG: prephenate dehydratase [Oscillospiraceae bacterium]|nr:prephenate dehydratase [Oscillospiraceae bacterium]
MLGYLGPSGTFSHQAAMNWSQGKEEIKEFSTIYSCILAVHNGQIDRAIVPIENSIDGSINTTLDALAFDVDLYITGEYILHISENLMVKKGTKKEDIKIITSHPQPIGQCSRLLSHEFADTKIEFAESTAAAAKRTAASDGSIACIGSPNSAELYGLDILYADCGDDINNSTRFVIIEKNPNTTVTEHDKSSIVFALDNKSGSLYSAIELLAKEKINMTKIESRPMKDKLGKYVFFIDIDGNIDDATIYFALDKVRQNTPFYKFLGSYKFAD